MGETRNKCRRSIRLKGYDYSKEGAYFITICVQNKRPLFGNIINDVMELNTAGQMVEKWWKKMFDKYKEIGMDEYMVMPDHFHGIIQIVGANLRIRPNMAIPCNRPNVGENMVSPVRDRVVSNNYAGLGRYISWFKRMSTNEYIRNVRNHDWQSFEKRVWQRNYYERVIRDEIELNEKREYIKNNSITMERKADSFCKTI